MYVVSQEMTLKPRNMINIRNGRKKHVESTYFMMTNKCRPHRKLGQKLAQQKMCYSCVKV